MLPIEKIREVAVHCSLAEIGKLTRCGFAEPTSNLYPCSFCSLWYLHIIFVQISVMNVHNAHNCVFGKVLGPVKVYFEVVYWLA